MPPSYFLVIAVIYFLYARIMARKKIKNWTTPVAVTGVFLAGQLFASFNDNASSLDNPPWIFILITLAIFLAPLSITILLNKAEKTSSHD